MVNNRKNRNKRNYLEFVLISTSFVAFYASYFNFYVADRCSCGGSKLSWLFCIVCESVGQTGASILWLAIGIFMFSMGVHLLSKKG